MSTCHDLLQQLKKGTLDQTLAGLYGAERLAQSRERAARAVAGFQAAFGEGREAALFSAPGRTELGGNHTDHQQGCVLCGSVDLDLLACAAPNESGRVRVLSQGYPMVELSLEDLLPREEERGTSAALIRGMAAQTAGMGYILSGFDAYVLSDVPVGSGLSSSAACEVLLGAILNAFCCGGQLREEQIALMGQGAENQYFGKPCGLMDQMSSAVGGAVAIDFRKPEEPLVQRIDFDFSNCGYQLCIVDTGSSHADLTDDYAAIPREMGAVAAHFGKKVLREVVEEDFRAAMPALRKKYGDRAVLRALHFYQENQRVAEEVRALEQGDFTRFLKLVEASGLSSALLLQNVCPQGASTHQAVLLALARGRELLRGKGAIRVHGGGFAGTIQAFVPEDELGLFCRGMEELLGKGCCRILRIRAKGGCILS